MSPRSRTTATTALISWAPVGCVGKCSCVGIGPPGFGDAQIITHHRAETQENKPCPMPMSGVLKLPQCSEVAEVTFDERQPHPLWSVYGPGDYRSLDQLGRA